MSGYRMWTEDDVIAETEALRKRADEAEQQVTDLHEEIEEMEDTHISASDVLVALVRAGLARPPALYSDASSTVPRGYLKLWLEEQLEAIEYRGGRRLP